MVRLAELVGTQSPITSRTSSAGPSAVQSSKPDISKGKSTTARPLLSETRRPGHHRVHIAALTLEPPVYNPGGPTALVHDFKVRHDADWDSVGRSLLYEAMREAKPREPFRAWSCAHERTPANARCWRRSEWTSFPNGT